MSLTGLQVSGGKEDISQIMTLRQSSCKKFCGERCGGEDREWKQMTQNGSCCSRVVRSNGMETGQSEEIFKLFKRPH